jgi:predicted 3-demethylubiquinone-9 3-methyltransferase (glyoxalase superfamily)
MKTNQSNITPFLWFNGNVEEAVNFYTSIFKNSKIISRATLPGEAPGRKGKDIVATIEMYGQRFMLLDGGPLFKFTPAVSFMVACSTPEEINELWGKLSNGGTALMPLNKYPFSEKFGWVQDKFGISWQLNLKGTNQTITPFLLFVQEQNGKAKEAINFYTSIFKNSATHKIAFYGAGEGGDEGTVKHAAFSLNGNEFMAMDSNGKHQFTFTPAISFFVNCTTQEEVDELWEKLSAGGKKDRCGWLHDKYGLSWQIIPSALMELMYSKDSVKSKRVMDAMMKMGKIEINKLEEAYNQK